MMSSPSRTKRSGVSPARPAATSGKEPVQRLLFLRLQLDVIAVPEGEAPKTVIFGLVEPLLAKWQFLRRFGFHRLERQRDRRGKGLRHVSSARRPKMAPSALCFALPFGHNIQSRILCQRLDGASHMFLFRSLCRNKAKNRDRAPGRSRRHMIPVSWFALLASIAV